MDYWTYIINSWNGLKGKIRQVTQTCYRRTMPNTHWTIQMITAKLCQASLENGSRDNVSCVAVLVQQASPTIALSKNSTMTSDDSSTNPTPLTD